jgi:class 3 adenylate cyclase
LYFGVREIAREKRVNKETQPHSPVAQEIALGIHSPSTPPEERDITVFRSDIENFTQASREHSAMKLALLVNDYLKEMAAIALRHQGTLNRLATDSVVVLFGAPSEIPRREQAQQAAAMAVAMREAIARNHAFKVRMGINSGSAVVGNYGAPERMDYSAIGFTVDLAAHLQANAEPGTIVIGPDTQSLLERHAICTPLPNLKVETVTNPMIAFRLDRLL